MDRKRVVCAVLAAMLAASPALSAAGSADPKPDAALRGPEPAAAPAAPARPETSDVQSDAALTPDLSTSSRAGGLEPPAGGAECRRSCADDLYMCRETRDESDCSPIWSRCAAACPEASSSPP